MSRNRATSVSSVLSCSQDSFFRMFEDGNPTSYHVGRAKTILSKFKDVLRNVRGVRGNYRLDILLTNMMRFAPTENGRRYVAIVIQLTAAADKDSDGNKLADVARQWLRHFFIPMLNKEGNTVEETVLLPRAVVAPNQDIWTAVLVDLVKDRDSKFWTELLERDLRKCVVTHREDYESAIKQEFQSSALKSRWPSFYGNLEGAHIIPFSLNSIKRKMAEAIATWDILQSWFDIMDDTNSIVEALSGRHINNPSNGIMLDVHTHSVFDRYFFYFEECDQRNRYVITLTIPGFKVISNSRHLTTEVMFTGDERNLPDRRLLKIHASIAKCIIPAKYPDLFPNWDDWLNAANE